MSYVLDETGKAISRNDTRYEELKKQQQNRLSQSTKYASVGADRMGSAGATDVYQKGTTPTLVQKDDAGNVSVRGGVDTSGNYTPEGAAARSTYSDVKIDGISTPSEATPAVNAYQPVNIRPFPGTTTPSSSSSALGGSSLFSDEKNIRKLWDAFGGDKRAMYSTILNKARENGQDGELILRQLNSVMKGYDPNKPVTPTVPEGEEGGTNTAPPPPTTGVEAIDETNEWANRLKEHNIYMLDEFKRDREAITDGIMTSQLASFGNQEKILDERMKQFEDTYEGVFDSIKELETYANKLFDINVVNAIQARGAQLVNKGILTSAQAAGATGGIMTLYRNQAEAKRSEIMVDIQKAMQDALVSKSNAIDAVLADKGLTEANKGLMIERVNKYYDDILAGHQTNFLAVNQAYDGIMANVLNQKISIDVAAKIKEVENEVQNNINDDRIQRANTDQSSRMDYIMSQVQATDPTLNKYAATIIKEYMDNGTFMTRPLTEIVAEVLQKSANMLLTDSRSAAAGTGGGGGLGSLGTNNTIGTTDTTDTLASDTDTANLTQEEIINQAISNIDSASGGGTPQGLTEYPGTNYYTMQGPNGPIAVDRQGNPLTFDRLGNPVILPTQENNINVLPDLNIMSTNDGLGGSINNPSGAMEQARAENIRASISKIGGKISQLEGEIVEMNAELAGNTFPTGSSYERMLRDDIIQKQKVIDGLKKDTQYLLSQQ